MSARLQLVIVALVVAIAAALTWLWHDQMEKRWTAVEKVSRPASENNMLAAARLLQLQGRPVTVAGSFGEIRLPGLADGTLIIADSSGITTPATAAALLAWVRRGNTLVTEPRWASPGEKAALLAADPALAAAHAADEDEEEEDAEDAGTEEDAAADGAAEDAQAEAAPPPLETDPLAVRFGVRQLYLYRTRKCSEREDAAANKATAPIAGRGGCIPSKDYVPRLHTLAAPGMAYPLTIDESYTSLHTMPGAAAPLWADVRANAVHVYGEGKGQVVMLAGNYFTNHDLKNYDHGELLLALAALSKNRSVTIVQMLDVLPWYVALWQHYRYLLLALAAFLALALWMAVRRFGPVLPQPAAERRSLMEHIAASGAWLWKADGGGGVLLDAAREETLSLLRRRAPALFRQPSQQLPALLARETGLDPEHLAEALQDDASRQNARFTRQIRTLQELRTHYER